MTKIDIFSGFLGAGKTTLIKKLIAEAFQGEKLVLIENEFGEIAVDGGFLQEAGIEITEMSQGCICCSLVGDFGQALRDVMTRFAPDRILIEPSGVGKLSDVIRAVQNLEMAEVELNSFTTVVDAAKCKIYAKNFGEFFDDQISHANSIVLSRTANISPEKLEAAIEIVRERNQGATLITTDWNALSGAQILAAMEQKGTLTEELKLLADETARRNEILAEEHEHHHHHHDHEECECHHEHEECECHHEHHHDEDHECCCHHHDHEECECHHEHHDHHHHHHHGADEIFESWGKETPKAYTVEGIEAALHALEDEAAFGLVLRAKGIVAGPEGSWIHFDYVPGEVNVRTGVAMVTGRLCVIGSALKKEALEALLG